MARAYTSCLHVKVARAGAGWALLREAEDPARGARPRQRHRHVQPDPAAVADAGAGGGAGLHRPRAPGRPRGRRDRGRRPAGVRVRARVPARARARAQHGARRAQGALRERALRRPPPPPAPVPRGGAVRLGLAEAGRQRAQEGAAVRGVDRQPARRAARRAGRRAGGARRGEGGGGGGGRRVRHVERPGGSAPHVPVRARGDRRAAPVRRTRWRPGARAGRPLHGQVRQGHRPRCGYPPGDSVWKSRVARSAQVPGGALRRRRRPRHAGAHPRAEPGRRARPVGDGHAAAQLAGHAGGRAVHADGVAGGRQQEGDDPGAGDAPHARARARGLLPAAVRAPPGRAPPVAARHGPGAAQVRQGARQPPRLLRPPGRLLVGVAR